MPELAGKDLVLKVSGAATPFVGEATTSEEGNLKYQITDINKQVLDMSALIRVHKKGSDDAAEVGTTPTILKMTGHGLVVGDLIINTTRENAARLVLTVPDANTITVDNVTSQASGDIIEIYKTESQSNYSLDKLNGEVTYSTALARTIKISGSYLPLSIAAYATKVSRSQQCDLLESSTINSDGYKKRVPGLKSASGTITHLDVVDTIYEDALLSGNPIVIEDKSNASGLPNRFWALFESDELTAAVDGLQEVSVSWTSTNKWLELGRN